MKLNDVDWGLVTLAGNMRPEADRPARMIKQMRDILMFGGPPHVAEMDKDDYIRFVRMMFAATSDEEAVLDALDGFKVRVVVAA